jgi:subfamily B ATP-binding cassette protein HlyB/CyaB
MDLSFSFVFLSVMYWYSPSLTLIAAAFMPAYIAISFIFTPILRARLNEKFNRSSENNSFLVETISGMETVKSMSVEPFWIHRWERQLAAYVTSGLRAVTTGLLASSSVQLVSRISTLTLIWAGAWRVMDGKLTIGELIAFNMLAGQVSAPILRLAQLWNDFQQVGISMQRLGDILNAKTEGATSRPSIPRVEGRIEFDEVSFRYKLDSPEILRNISFQVSPGETIGIVGRSGSGKSTITKLIQRLYVPDRGRIRIDGFDLSVVDAPSLRDQVGVVLQESTLFNRSIRDNIALSDPLSAMEDVIYAARLAGAHDFICELPAGYDTSVGENGSSLSGGQRQRIALARALLKNPRILILDEATSALDYESEHIIQQNMDQIRRGRTVIIVAHRLSAVRDADRIFVIDRGEIVESGRQDELLRKPGGTYAHLYRMQAPSTASITRIGA